MPFSPLHKKVNFSNTWSHILQIFKKVSDPTDLHMFEDGKRADYKQATHSVDSVKLLEHDLKQALLGLAHSLFGKS